VGNAATFFFAASLVFCWAARRRSSRALCSDRCASAFSTLNPILRFRRRFCVICALIAPASRRRRFDGAPTSEFTALRPRMPAELRRMAPSTAEAFRAWRQARAMMVARVSWQHSACSAERAGLPGAARRRRGECDAVLRALCERRADSVRRHGVPCRCCRCSALDARVVLGRRESVGSSYVSLALCGPC